MRRNKWDWENTARFELASEWAFQPAFTLRALDGVDQTGCDGM